ncbi:MAG: hypothetical protein PUB21_11085 [Bacteroidales bacterium]|nr:hypothetical protein [Bacteroidales bacterium]
MLPISPTPPGSYFAVFPGNGTARTPSAIPVYSGTFRRHATRQPLPYKPESPPLICHKTPPRIDTLRNRQAFSHS